MFATDFVCLYCVAPNFSNTRMKWYSPKQSKWLKLCGKHCIISGERHESFSPPSPPLYSLFFFLLRSASQMLINTGVAWGMVRALGRFTLITYRQTDSVAWRNFSPTSSAHNPNEVYWGRTRKQPLTVAFLPQGWIGYVAGRAAGWQHSVLTGWLPSFLGCWKGTGFMNCQMSRTSRRILLSHVKRVCRTEPQRNAVGWEYKSELEPGGRCQAHRQDRQL